MTEIRVRCPECQTGFRLAKPAEKVRCPKCQSVFQIEDEMPESPRKPNLSKGKSKKSTKRRTSNFEADKLTNFGWILAVCGALSFVLPAFGIQIKGLHRLSPEAQTIGGILFLLVGGLILAVAYGRSWLSDLPKGGKWSVILGGGVLVVVVVGLSVMFFAPNKQSGTIPDRNVDLTGADAPNMAQQGQPIQEGPAGDDDPAQVSQLERFPRPTQESMCPERRQPQPDDVIGPGGVVIPNGGVVNPPGIGGNPLRNSGNPAQIPGAPPGLTEDPTGNPGVPPGFPRPNMGNMSLEEQFAYFGPDRTVTIVFTGPQGAVNFTQMLSRFQQNGSGIQIGSGGGSGQTYTMRVAPVKDIQKFADKIGVGTVTQVDQTKRVINVKLQ